MHQEQLNRTTVSLDIKDTEELDDIKKEIGLKQRPDTIRFLMNFWKQHNNR